MDLLKEILILLQHWLWVNANNFLITNPNSTHTLHHNGLDTNIVKAYEDFMNGLTFGNPIKHAIVGLFSGALKDSYWCYPPYPCFQIGGPFISPYHPISLPPFPPMTMNITMELFTRRNPDIPFEFNYNNISQINDSYFNKDLDTKFIIGGFLSGDGLKIRQMITPALLTQCDCNVFNVNWRRGSVTTYAQAVANARVVGAVVGRFMELLKNETGNAFRKMHLIGHSLGSHVCGYAGEAVSGQIGRISGLDPAGPYFYKTDPRVRLDPSDAQLVDIIHTNAGSIFTASAGIDEKIGHLDFYPNGGSRQPGCSVVDKIRQGESLIEASKSLFSGCDHGRAVSLYTESITNPMNTSCKFTSFACSDYNSFQLGHQGQCRTCGLDGDKCPEMGFNSDKYASAGHLVPSPNNFFLYTNGLTPYCKN